LIEVDTLSFLFFWPRPLLGKLDIIPRVCQRRVAGRVLLVLLGDLHNKVKPQMVEIVQGFVEW